MKVYRVFSWPPDYYARPERGSTKHIFSSRELAEIWISEQPGWGGIGVGVDYYVAEHEVLTNLSQTNEYKYKERERKERHANT